MLLQITTTHHPATDLGYLLHKHPDKVQEFELPFGKAQVFYPEATAERTTAVLALDIDSVGLVRNRRGSGGEGPTLDQYVNDRPYTASSFLNSASPRLAPLPRLPLDGRCSRGSDIRWTASSRHRRAARRFSWGTWLTVDRTPPAS